MPFDMMDGDRIKGETDFPELRIWREETEITDLRIPQGLEIGFDQRGLLRSAAGIVVFDDNSGRAFKFGDQTARRFQVDIIIVGKFFSLELFGGSQTFELATHGDIKPGMLVRILSITQFLLAAQ